MYLVLCVVWWKVATSWLAHSLGGALMLSRMQSHLIQKSVGCLGLELGSSGSNLEQLPTPDCHRLFPDLCMMETYTSFFRDFAKTITFIAIQISYTISYTGYTGMYQISYIIYHNSLESSHGKTNPHRDSERHRLSSNLWMVVLWLLVIFQCTNH